MTTRSWYVLPAAFLFTIPGIADDKHKAPGRNQSETAYREARDANVSYGRIRQFDVGQKVVVDVDNALDKSFDLTDDDETVNIASDLRVGDPVKITEHKVNGRQTVDIVRHSDPSVRHGDRSAQADRLETQADVTYGRVKEFGQGHIVIDVDNAVDQKFDLADDDPKVNVAAGLKIGDPVKVTEREINGQKTVQVVKHTGGGVQHGDPDHKK